MTENSLSENNQFEIKCSEVFPDLIETALLASRFGMPDEADCIVEAVEKFRPNHRSIFICKALCRLYSNRAVEAIGILSDSALKSFPDDHGLMVYLSMAFAAAGMDQKAKAILNEVEQNSKDQSIIAMSRNVLDTIHNGFSEPVTSTVFHKRA